MMLNHFRQPKVPGSQLFVIVQLSGSTQNTTQSEASGNGQIFLRRIRQKNLSLGITIAFLSACGIFTSFSRLRTDGRLHTVGLAMILLLFFARFAFADRNYFLSLCFVLLQKIERQCQNEPHRQDRQCGYYHNEQNGGVANVGIRCC